MSYLGIYLNDHLAGATAGVGRIRRLARSSRGSEAGAPLGAIAAEITEDRRILLGIMRSLGVPARRYKVLAGRLAEAAGRLKSNGRVVRRSPLSTLLELELMRVAVEGKTAGWQALRLLATTDARLDAGLLDDLLERARRQQHTLEEIRRRQIETVFRTG
jgi:hypothetical protein